MARIRSETGIVKVISGFTIARSRQKVKCFNPNPELSSGTSEGNFNIISKILDVR